jgi:hypothetical protein
MSIVIQLPVTGPSSSRQASIAGSIFEDPRATTLPDVPPFVLRLIVNVVGPEENTSAVYEPLLERLLNGAQIFEVPCRGRAVIDFGHLERGVSAADRWMQEETF